MRGPALLLSVAAILAGCAAPTSSSSAAGGTSPSPTASATVSISASPSGPEPTPTALASAAEPTSWERVETSGPSAREDHSWTLAGSTNVAYLFGGRDGATVHADTWAFDLDTGTWAQLAATASPAGRFGHEATWVEGVGVVVFGGQGGPTTFFNDLWVLDPAAATWRQLPSDGSVPTPRYGSCLALGPDGMLWMSHGFTQEGSRFSDTRAYDLELGRWEDITPDGRRPVERCLHGCWWTDDGELVLYAGQTTGATALDDLWTLVDGAWERSELQLPPGRNLYARGRIEAGTLVFGGQAVDGTYLGDLWLLPDGDVAAPVAVEGRETPAARAGAELIVDRASSRAFLFGGRTADSALDDTWMLRNP
ncbi:MAG: hypothetical protein K5924_01310 [Chloroflexi bacterium]|nr:hypothetical protein [Chloroflexota bacterium]